ncbi:hypothetical protein JHK85_004704 [Glycine max]|nr:hypothetical protein JHK85_004704 [Glycine max]KAG5080460.1 hypothetical protein JHK86_004525 [Glycine max]
MFFNNKKLMASDVVMFLKNSRGGLFGGIYCTTRFSMGKGGGRGVMRIKMGEEEKEEEVREVFSREGWGKLSAKVVAGVQSCLVGMVEPILKDAQYPFATCIV